jgi:hypothetical protein
MRRVLVHGLMVLLLGLAAPGLAADGDGTCRCSARHPIGFGCSMSGPCPCECHCPLLGTCSCTCGGPSLHNPPAP